MAEAEGQRIQLVIAENHMLKVEWAFQKVALYFGYLITFEVDKGKFCATAYIRKGM